MTIGDHLHELYRLPAYDFPGPDAKTDGLPDPESVAWRVKADVYDSDEGWTDAFARFRGTVDTTRLRALIVGAWSEAYETGPSDVIEALLAAREHLPALRALFLGDMVMEECEISWINQSDVTPLLTGFPALEEFGVRGGTGLEFPALSHGALRKLVVETGGLPADVVRGIGGSDLPALEHLDLWLGTPDYGGDSEAADLEPILSGARLPRLRHLSLRNSEMQDAVAAAVASAPVVARLEVLDLSMGVLTDEGAGALLSGQPLTHLRKLDLHHHYLSKPFEDRVRQTLEPAGVEVDLDRDDAEEETEGDGTVWRYVAVGE
ncbi:STM4015 family protein [Streptomyces sp. ALI-76-A]|uniref:STM4015 family protein n=1 Tax=Streptomyces sp. ALI-76-A TaxID=3025736 RepID=UPI00256F61A5|nr:STM4015 family protein [Streptomyces sp. ALI-76-A]MDL5199228.1 STM4015 family protein [Streptomyces sp. ALI-76-A]